MQSLSSSSLAIFPVYIDGNQKPFTDDTISTIVKGDYLLKPISAASIIAKVTRDSLMTQYAQEYPNYGWAQNAGYGTKKSLFKHCKIWNNYLSSAFFFYAVSINNKALHYLGFRLNNSLKNYRLVCPKVESFRL